MGPEFFNLCYSWIRNLKRLPCNSRTLQKRLRTLNKTTTKMSTISWAYATSLTAKVGEMDIKPCVPYLSITHSCQSWLISVCDTLSHCYCHLEKKNNLLECYTLFTPKHVNLKCHIRCKFWLSSSADIPMERQHFEHHAFVFRWREISEEPLRAETPSSVGIHGSF